MSSKSISRVLRGGLRLAAIVSVGFLGQSSAYAESTPAACAPVQIEPANGVLPSNIGGISFAQDFAGWSAFRGDAGQPAVVEARLRAVGATDTVPLEIDVDIPSDGRINVRFRESIAPGSRVELTYPDCWGPSEHTIDFVEPVEFASPLAAPEVGSPVRRGGDVTGSDYLPVRQPLSDLEASLGFKMRVTKDGRMLGRQPLDTTEVPISRCSDDGMLAEVSLKVEILSPVGDVVAEGLETLVSYDCAELEIIMTGPNAGPDGGSTPAADGGVGGAEAPARSGCSVGVNGGESTGLGFWALLGAVMLGRRQRSRA